MKMTFGKYKGQELDDLPDHYIQWLLEEATLPPKLRDELEAIHSMRQGEGVVRKKGQYGA